MSLLTTASVAVTAAASAAPVALEPFADPVKAPAGQLVLAALAGIGLLVLLITKYKLHPFLSLTIGSLLVGVVGGLSVSATTDSFTKGVGSTVAGVGLLIALGAMIGKLLADSGGADQIVDTIIGKASPAALPWAMGLVGAIIGLPMFFEIGLVLLIPVILMVTRRSGLPLMKIGIPALAGLSAMHGFVPPHPGPLAAVDALKANLGLTLGLGVLVAIPVVIVAGPLFSTLAARWVPVGAPDLFLGVEERTATAGAVSASGPAATGSDVPAVDGRRRRPSFGATLFTVLLVLAIGAGSVFFSHSFGATLFTVLLVLAIGAGSVFFSHVNDAGFWLVKEYFGLDVGQNLKTWSVMETVISVVGLLVVLVASLFV
jgi:GntP family gluconate:H+ symporter